jgi:putative oxygen-independent coproporphyrinogen III oxidase
MANDQIDDSTQEIFGIYIHIPFCQKKCRYCDFASQPIVSASQLDHYFSCLNQEILHRAHGTISTIYFGGGTPSLADEGQLASVLDSLLERMQFESNLEITLEANPATLDQEKLENLRVLGVNRIALGVQSTQDKYLKTLGRSHTTEQTLQSIQDIRAQGFSNLSCDLMFGLPGQTLSEFQHDLKTLLQWNPEHISMYALSLEESTPLEKDVRRGIIPEPDDDIAAEMYTWAIAELKQHGYQQYEICSFSKPGHECQHNTIYWKNKSYLGFGTGAHSFERGIRKWNESRPASYEEKIIKRQSALSGEEKLQGRARIAEHLIVGLRLSEGVNKQEIQEYYGQNWEQDFAPALAKMVAQGLLLDENNTLKLTAQGVLLSNRVFREIL